MASATPFNPSQLATVLIAGTRMDMRTSRDVEAQHQLQEQLKTARIRYGSALCNCRPIHLKLQIRLRDSKFHLAVWPREGPLHDGACFFQRDDIEQAEPELVAAVRELPDGTQRIDLQFALDRSPPGPGGTVGPSSPSGPSTPSNSSTTSLRALLHLLWTASKLTQWHPSWSRDWGRTRYELVRSAGRIFIEDQPLANRLFVPRPYRETIKARVNQEWEDFAGLLGRYAGARIPSGILIAPVKKWVCKPHNGRDQVVMHMAHMRYPIEITEPAHSFVRHNCKAALSRLTSDEGESTYTRPSDWVDLTQPSVVCIAVVESSTRGGLRARALWLMLAHPRLWIPAANRDEIALLDALVMDGQQFARILSTRRTSERTEPEWLLRHVLDPEGRPVPRAALQIINHGAGEPFKQALHQVRVSLGGKGIPTWAWTPTGPLISRQVPPLPPSQGMHRVIANKTLKAITAAPSVSYAYGMAVTLSPST